MWDIGSRERLSMDGLGGGGCSHLSWMERRQMMVTRDHRQIDFGLHPDSGRGQRQARRGSNQQEERGQEGQLARKSLSPQANYSAGLWRKRANGPPNRPSVICPRGEYGDTSQG